MQPSKNLKKQLASLVETLEMTPEMEDYLLGRGINPQVAQRFNIGGVPDDAANWSDYAGMVALPYMTATGPVNCKFRSINQKKYLGMPNLKPGLYNSRALLEHSDTVVVCEGEFDTVIVHGQCGIPAVGIAGVNNWQPWFARVFDGHNNVLIAVDNDDKEDGSNPGRELANKILKEVPHATLSVPPKGMDVTDVFLEGGQLGVLDMLGVTA